LNHGQVNLKNVKGVTHTDAGAVSVHNAHRLVIGICAFDDFKKFNGVNLMAETRQNEGTKTKPSQKAKPKMTQLYLPVTILIKHFHGFVSDCRLHAWVKECGRSKVEIGAHQQHDQFLSIQALRAVSGVKMSQFVDSKKKLNPHWKLNN
jgi:hypothetical protein